MLWFPILLVLSACVVHSQREVADPAQPVRAGGSAELRLRSAAGAATGWLPVDRLVVVGDKICVRPAGAAWASVTAIEIDQLSDDNIAAILVDLPRDIRVNHLGRGTISLATNGRTLTRWLRSVAHDPRDVGVARYRVLAGDRWSEPMTWADLPSAGRPPQYGWPTLGTTAEVREVSVAGTIAVTVAVAPFVLIAAGIAVAATVPLPDGNAPDPIADRERARAGARPLEAIGRLGEAAARSHPGSWAPMPCPAAAAKRGPA